MNAPPNGWVAGVPVTADPRLPLSCFIIAKNEADRIAPVVESVIGWVDEVVVVDSGSTDGTQELAARLGARVIHNDWPGFGPQKRFGEDQCRNDWLLNLDADEVPTEALCREIIALFSDGVPPHPFYRFRTETVYPGDSRPRLWADYHNFIRLYDRRVGRFSESPVHDTVQPGDIPARELKAPAWHHSYRSFSFMVQKLNAYSDLQAKTLHKPGRARLLIRLPFEMPLAFLKYYFLRRHFTGGLRGFIYAMIEAFYRFLRLAKLLETSLRRNG